MNKKAFYTLSAVAVIAFSLLVCMQASAQTSTIDAKQNQSKPTAEQTNERQESNPAPAATASPPGPVHCIAEWEESEGILTLWKNADLMNKLQQEHLVYIPVDNASEETQWRTWLTNNGIPQDNFSFLYIQTNTIWTRDYGPWFIWDANNDMGIVNYTCQYGYWDDLFPSYFASMYGINFYESGLYHVGGNYYPNAYGRAFSSTHVYESNPNLTKAEVDGAMQLYYGIENYHTVAPKAIWHHDTWGKPANPETMIVVDFPDYDKSRHAQANAMAGYYATLESPWGRPYKLHRLPMMPQSPGGTYYRPYMNSLVSNKQVFVPVHDHPDDAVALAVFEEAFAGYDVVGVIAQSCGWPDALHCRTRNFMKRDLIRMYPYPPGDTEETSEGYPVRAEVIPPNGSTLLTGYPVIHYTTTGGAPYTDVVMQATGQPNEYAEDIPAQAQGTTVSFYIEAKDDGGLEAVYPLVTPDALMTFQVREDTEAPILSRHVPTRSACANGWPARVRTLCKDDMTCPVVTVDYSINHVPQGSIELTREHLCYWFSDALGGSVSPGDVVTYSVTATDDAVTPHTDTLPLVGEYYCPITDTGSIAVVNLCPRPYSAPFFCDALGDLGLAYNYYESWPTDWDEHDIWFICLGVFADNYVLSASEATDIETALQNGNYIYLEGGNTWCTDPEKQKLQDCFFVEEFHTWASLTQVDGMEGTLADGLQLRFVGEDLQMDAIDPVRPAETIFEGQGNRGRAILHDGGTYRTIASTFSLGGLLDKPWPNTRKEILRRYLEFFGVDTIKLFATGDAVLGHYVDVRIEGDENDSYILLASLAEFYKNMPNYGGACRLDPTYLFTLAIGTIPSSGLVEIPLAIPRDESLLGLEVHLQAATGVALAPGQAVFTNRDIMTVIE